MHKPMSLFAVLACAALSSACGGGGAALGDAAAAAVPDRVPAAATASADAFTRFAGGLADDDQREPLAVDDLAPPTSETAEPTPVMR